MQTKFRTGAGTGQVQALPLPSLKRGGAGACSLTWIRSQAETVKGLALRGARRCSKGERGVLRVWGWRPVELQGKCQEKELC